MISKDLKDYLVIVEECSKRMLETSSTGIHDALKSLYRVLKKYDIQNKNLKALKIEEYEAIYMLIKSLLLILIDDGVPPDAMLLCSTCLTLLVSTIFYPEFTSSFLMNLYCHFQENYSGRQTISDESKKVFKEEMFEIAKCFVCLREYYVSIKYPIFDKHYKPNNFSSLKTPSFQEIAILNGIVSCQIPELYSFQLHYFENKPFLIYIFSATYRCCLSPSIHQYHAFTVLLNWMRMCEMFSDTFPIKDVFFSTNAIIVQKTLDLLESNWQSPIKGVNGFIKELYKYLIKLNEKESKKLATDHLSLIQYLLEKTMMLSWQVKGKYFLLSVLLQHVDYSKFFYENPDAPANIIFSLKTNYISSSAAEVYKVIVTNIKKSNDAEILCLEWCKWWRIPILRSLCSNDRLLIQNVTNYILPWTIKQFPKSYDLMMESESYCRDDSVKLLLLHILKENFSRTLCEKELTLIDKNLHHSDIQIRLEVLSILCSSPKKSEPVKSSELEYIKSFILENLNIDSAPFHQHLLSQLHTLLIRIRDSLVQQHRSKIQNKDFIVDLSQLEFVDWIAHTCVQNTFPGACFQRRRLSLQLLNIIYDVFIESPLGYKRKEKPSKSVKQVIEWAQENNLWLFFNNDILAYILPCITDFADEIRSLCANLLCAYSSWPALDNCETINKAAVTEFAFILCNHPDYRNNDGGAHICCIIFNRLCLQPHQGESNKALDFLKYLVSETKLQLQSAKEDFLSGAISKPIHGILLALQYCLADSKSFFEKSYQHEEEETSNFLKDLMYLCFDIVNYMLKIMKGENEKFYCPSFSDIGIALEKLVLSKKKASSNMVNEFDNNESSDYAMQCDLLLSCCWHSIKNSCFLLCEVSSSVVALNINYVEKEEFLHKIAEEFLSVLIACRHRGVVEACSGALNKFCTNLLKDKSLYENITMELVQKVFETLTDSTKVSVTRRSAGLPLLFQAVVSSEENNIKRQLLSYTIDNLLKLINKPLPSLNSISEKTDLPQAHAYHILKALVLDARLSQSILPYFDSIIPICIAAFSSTVWSVQNGALQLFGVILPRVCGQKKVRDDDSEHNTVSAFELFARCPSLKTYLLQELTKCVKFHLEKRLCSELVPILSLLVKLMPEREDQSSLTDLISTVALLKLMKIFMNDFTPLLLELLNIPVWKVRDLVSSALSLLMSNSEIVHLLEEILQNLISGNIKSNQIHSQLLITQKFMKRKCDNILSNMPYIEENLMNVYTLVCQKLRCPLLLGITVDMIILVSDAKHDISLLECIDRSNINCGITQTHEIGLFFYETKTVLVDLKLCSLKTLPQYVKEISLKNTDICIVCLQFLNTKLNSERSAEQFYSEDNLKLWKDIFVSVLEYISPEKHPSVIKEALEFMINLCSNYNVGNVVIDSIVNSVIENLECHLDKESGLSISAFAFSMWSICIKTLLENTNQCPKKNIEKWSLLFYSYCQPRSTEVLRLQAAKSLAILGPTLAKYLTSDIEKKFDYSDQVFIELCEGSLLLLQDEDEDIRNEACKFPSQIPHDYQATTLQFNICIKVIFQYMLQVLHSRPFYILYLWNRLQNYPSTAKVLQSYSTKIKVNLFEQEYVNVFAEPYLFLMQHQQNFKTVLSNLSKENYKFYHENISMFLCDLEVELQDVCLILSSLSPKKSNQSFTYHHQAYLALKKLRCQVDALLSQKHSILTEDPLHDKLTNLGKEWSKIEKLLPSATCFFLNTL